MEVPNHIAQAKLQCMKRWFWDMILGDLHTSQFRFVFICLLASSDLTGRANCNIFQRNIETQEGIQIFQSSSAILAFLQQNSVNFCQNYALPLELALLGYFLLLCYRLCLPWLNSKNLFPCLSNPLLFLAEVEYFLIPLYSQV